jgi:hypothetical protein
MQYLACSPSQGRAVLLCSEPTAMSAAALLSASSPAPQQAVQLRHQQPQEHPDDCEHMGNKAAVAAAAATATLSLT